MRLFYKHYYVTFQRCRNIIEFKMRDIKIAFLLLILYLVSFLYILVPRDNEENVEELKFTINNGTYATRERNEIENLLTYSQGSTVKISQIFLKTISFRYYF